MIKDLKRYVELRSQIQALKDEQEQIAKRIRREAEKGEIRCDGYNAKLRVTQKVEYDTVPALTALAEAGGEQALGAAVSLTKTGVERALGYLAGRVTNEQIGELKDKLQSVCKINETYSLSVRAPKQ